MRLAPFDTTSHQKCWDNLISGGRRGLNDEFTPDEDLAVACVAGGGLLPPMGVHYWRCYHGADNQNVAALPECARARLSA